MNMPMQGFDVAVQYSEGFAMPRAQGRKKSQFPGQTSVLSGAHFDFFVSGVNYRISYTDLLAALGATGTLQQVGAIDGTPVLQIAGQDNNIRNIEDGAGIQTSISPENGIALETTFIPGVGGSPILVDETGEFPKVKNLIAGSGITVGATADALTISTTEAPPTSNIVIVNSITDLPAPIGDLITLEEATTYSLQGLINLGVNRLLIPNGVQVFSDNRLTWGFTSTTTGPLITVNDGGAVILREMLLNVPNGSYFDTSGLGDLVITNVVGAASGVVSAMGPMNTTTFGPFSPVGTFPGANKGFLFTGAHQQLNIFRGFYQNWTGTLFDLGSATFAQGITFGTGIRMLSASGTTVLSGLAADANIPSGATALVLGNKFLGVGTNLVGITNSDARWQFIGNDTIGDTRTTGLLSLQANATATVIAVTSTPVLVAGTWTIETFSQMTLTTGGRQTYDSDKPQTLPVMISATVEPVTGNNINIGVFVAINGVPVANSRRIGQADANAPVSVTLPWELELTAGDFLEVFVSNETNTTNILVSNATFLVN